jgi:hypothetical protein
MSAFILHERYFDPVADRTSSYFCQLFVQIGQDSVRYSLLDTEKNTFIALADYILPAVPKTPDTFYILLGQLFSGEEMLKKKYPSVVVGIDTPWHTLVPAPLTDTELLHEILAFNHRLPPGCRFASDPVEEIDAFNVYGFMPGLDETIKHYLEGSAMIHRSSALVKAFCQHHRINPDSSCLYLNIGEHLVDLACFDAGRPLFYNSFNVQNKEDILYYTLYAMGQLKLRGDSACLALSGAVDTGSDTYRMLEQYVRTIEFLDRPLSFNYGPLISQLPAHRYLELFALALCGS